MKRHPDVTEEEIKSYMNFDKVLAKRNTIVRTGNFFKAGLAVSGVTVLSVLLYVYTPKELSHSRSVAIPAPDEPKKEILAQPQQTVNDKTDVVPVEIQKEEEVIEQQVQPEAKSKKSNEIPQVPENLYVQAEPVNGYDYLFSYFRSNLTYPKEAVADSIQGVLTVSFVINKEGKPQNVEFQKSLGAPFEKEALKLIQQMPPWKPASLNGKPVSSKISVPLTFELIKK